MGAIFVIAVAAVLAGCMHDGNRGSEELLPGDWIEVMPVNTCIIQGISFGEDGTAHSIGLYSILYRGWKVEGDRLVLYGETVEEGRAVPFRDTLDIIRQTCDSLTVGKHGAYRREYCRRDMRILDSLRPRSGTGPLLSETFVGEMPVEGSGVEAVHEISIYHRRNSGDGVFEAAVHGSGADVPERMIRGRQYTLRGDAVNPDATVVQLISFDGGDTVNLVRGCGELKLLDKSMRPLNPGYCLRLRHDCQNKGI